MYKKEVDSRKYIVVGIGMLVVILILIGSIFLMFSIGGFNNGSEFFFFVKRKIVFVTYKLYDLLF